MKTKYLIVTEPLDPKIAQARKDYDIEYAEGEVEAALEELEAAKSAPLQTEGRHQLEVLPGHPDYDKASDTPDEALWMAGLIVSKLMEKSPWNTLLESGEFPHNLGEVN